MATDIVGGTGGGYTATGFNVDVDNVSVTIENETATYRTFASRWRKSKPVTSFATGSFAGTIQKDDADTQPVPDDAGVIDVSAFGGVDLTLTMDDGCTITGTFNITSVDLSRPATDRMTGTFNVESDGEVEITWAEGA